MPDFCFMHWNHILRKSLYLLTITKIAAYMKRIALLAFLSLAILRLNAQTPTPDKLWGQLFKDVQLNRVFADNKTFVDCLPKYKPAVILKKYKREKSRSSFDLKTFVLENFDVPTVRTVQVTEGLSLREHLEQLWDLLKRDADTPHQYSSLLPLPYPYIVPGGRFREIYYWDSYFTMQGLAVSNRYDMIENMVNNFSYLIQHYGHIPNGNRNYYLGRSQPPYFAMMVDLLHEHSGDSVYLKYLPSLEKEYTFWMQGTDRLNNAEVYRRVIKMPDGSILNRHWDDVNAPRQESYAEDVATAKKYTGNDGKAYVNLRATAESGWDFCSRWFRDTMHLVTIATTDIVPVDLNCLMYNLEVVLSKANAANGDAARAAMYKEKAEKRRAAVLKYFWDDQQQYFFDYDRLQKKTTGRWSIAGIMPLFNNLSDSARAALVSKQVREKFLKEGGIVATLYHTGEQWDAPNGWAPLMFLAVKGLLNYHYDELAREAAERWMKLNEKVFAATGKMMEKYNVEDLELESGGGEYPTQDGFGWTNGVYLAFYHLFRQ
jgi:alpha,alpha-trehalase